MAIQSYIVELNDLVTMFKLAHILQNMRTSITMSEYVLNSLNVLKNLLHASENSRIFFGKLIWNGYLVKAE